MDRARRSPLRFLAPIGLVVFVIAFLLVLTSADDASDEGESNRANDAAEQRDLRGRDDDAGDRRERRRERRDERADDDVYVVKEGDTLGSIAEATGISVEKLQELNPELDPQALVTGQEVRLRE